ncbi:TPA: hypothetical protein ACQJXY_003360 [Citrobacter freundii]
MTEFSKEQLAEYAKGCIEHAEKFQDIEIAQQEKALFELALAALTAPIEPVYQYRIRNCYNGQVTEWQTIRRDQVDFVLKAQPHNAEFQIITPSAPLLPKPAVVPTFDEWCASTDRKPLGWVKDAMREAYDGCHAAMLHG